MVDEFHIVSYVETWRDVASRQGAVLTRAQLRGSGVTRRQLDRLVATESLVRVGRGLYTQVGVAGGWEAELWMAVLDAGPGAVAYRLSAGAWWQLDGVPAGAIEVAVGRGHQSRSARTCRLPTLKAEQVTHHHGLPITTTARTLADLGGVASHGTVERALESSLRTGLVALEEVEALAGSLRSRGAGVLRSVLAVRPRGAPPTGSDAETLFAQIARRCGLPPPERQYRVLLRGREYRLDFAWPALRLAVEIDGFEVHGRPGALRADLRRQNRIQLDGWLILRFTWADLVQHPLEVEGDLRAGWSLRGGVVPVVGSAPVAGRGARP